jgi:SAM-dependent methyltransferase
MPYARTEAWLRFFGGIADRIQHDIQPQSVLDAGCAMGFLVECLRDRGIAAHGIDISAYAIEHVRADIRPYCWVGSVFEPLPGTYDLIVCIEVLEHLAPQQCEQAVYHFSQASNDVLFSSTPDDYREPTHINVRPPEYWAGLFARHGFYRDVSFDTTFVTGWAIRFRKTREPIYRLVEAYERRLWLLNQEAIGTRRYAHESRTQLAEQERRIRELEAHCVSAGEESAQLRGVLDVERQRRQAATTELSALTDSPGWRFVNWVGHTRQRLFPLGSRRGQWWTRSVNRLSTRFKR